MSNTSASDLSWRFFFQRARQVLPLCCVWIFLFLLGFWGLKATYALAVLQKSANRIVLRVHTEKGACTTRVNAPIRTQPCWFCPSFSCHHCVQYTFIGGASWPFTFDYTVKTWTVIQKLIVRGPHWPQQMGNGAISGRRWAIRMIGRCSTTRFH